MKTTASIEPAPLENSSQEIPISETASKHEVVRYFYLDNLRALAMLAGILFHVGAAFSIIIAEAWPSANSETSIWFDYWLWILHTFRMPLFFLIAGFFAHFLIKKYGLKGFIKNRAIRIALPFIIFWPLITAAFIGMFIYAAFNMQIDNPVINMIRLAIENPEAMNGQKPPISTTHLWFIYYLSWFCLIAAILYRFINASIANRIYQLLGNSWFLFLGLPLLTCISLSRQFTPFPAPESFIPALWALTFYGLFFVLGWAFFIRQELITKLQKFWPYLMICSAAAGTILITLLPEPITLATAQTLFLEPRELTFEQLLRAFATAILAWYMSFLCLIAAQKTLDIQNPVLRYIADGSYWVYIIHVPIVFYLQLLFHNIDIPLVLEFLLISAITLILGYLSYALLVRHTPIGWLLNGRKNAPSK